MLSLLLSYHIQVLHRKRTMSESEVLMYLDYGTNYDSQGIVCLSCLFVFVCASQVSCYSSIGDHVDLWGATLATRECGVERLHRFIVIYTKDFDEDKANKNWHTSVLCLREMVSSWWSLYVFCKRLKICEHLDPERGVDGVSWLRTLCPKVQTLLVSGDSGNGFRGWEMCYYYSTPFEDYSIRVLQIPCAPRHAFNLMDSALARLSNSSRNLSVRAT